MDERNLQFMFREYDVVRVARLARTDREFSGSEGVRRPPQVGDIATIVHAYDPTDASAPFIVECVAKDGYTVWLADFAPEEHELEVRPNEHTKVES